MLKESGEDVSVDQDLSQGAFGIGNVFLEMELLPQEFECALHRDGFGFVSLFAAVGVGAIAVVVLVE